MLYIMRHGRTDWNDLHKLQGQTDVPLNENGREMARNAAKECAGIHFDVCFCSPLIRAKETAEILLEGRDVPLIIDGRLIEMGFGVFEGVENSFRIPDCPVNVLFLEPEKYVTPVEEGESLDALFARTGEFLEETVRPLVEQGKDVLAVSHGVSIAAMICRVKGLPLESLFRDGIKNCKLMRLM